MAATAAERATVLNQNLTRRLLLQMVRGQIVSGNRLVEATLAAQFNVSRTPIREALLQLSAIGLVELRPNCGAVMRKFGLQQIREIYEVREVLEVEACRRACGRIAPVVLQELIATFETLKSTRLHNTAWKEEEWRADCRLHGLVMENCGNARLAEEVASYNEFVQIVRESVGNRRRVQERALDEHIAILQGLNRNDPEAAAAAMREHVRSAATLALEALAPYLQ